MGLAAIRGKNPLLDKDFLNSFVKGVLETLKTTADTPVRIFHSEVVNDYRITGDVAGIVSLQDEDWTGNLILAFPKKTILYVIEQMLGETYPDINPEVRDAVGELTNQVYGYAKSILNQKGYQLQMGFPTIALGQFQLHSYPPTASLLIQFEILADPSLKFDLQVTYNSGKN